MNFYPFQLEAAEDKIYVDVGMIHKIHLSLRVVRSISF